MQGGLRGWAGALTVWCLILVGVLVGHAALSASGAIAAVPQWPDVANLTGVLLVGMIGNPIVARSFDELNRLTNPQVLASGEDVPWLLFDTQLYTSGTTVQQTFFRAQQADQTLSNMEQGAALTDKRYFEIWHLGIDILNDASVTTDETGIMNDIQRLMLVGRPVWRLTLDNKVMGQFPASPLHTSGGAVGSIAVGGTAGAVSSVQVGNNGPADGGWCWYGGLILPPKIGWGVVLDWTAAQTLAAGNPYIRFWMSGTMHRRVS